MRFCLQICAILLMFFYIVVVVVMVILHSRYCRWGIVLTAALNRVIEVMIGVITMTEVFNGSTAQRINSSWGCALGI
jgi:hypothetical protein